MQKYYTVYQITNRFNGKIYIGVHVCKEINDRYFGSGTEIKEALKKEGRKSFIKTILFVYNNKEEMLFKEKELVTKEFCMREDTYNRMIGGGTYTSIDMITAKDKDGKTFRIYRDDPRYLSGELIFYTSNMVVLRDKESNIVFTSINDTRYVSGELTGATKGTICVKDKNNNSFRIKEDDPRFLTGEFVGITKGYVQHPNQSWVGKKHSEESKQKISEKAKLRTGEKSSQFGSCWITNGIENKKIKKDNLNSLEEGWIKGRKIKQDFL